MNLEHRPLTRDAVDRARAVSVRLGGRVTVSGMALCDEIVRLHDVMAAAWMAVAEGRSDDALALLAAEVDASWARPIDESGSILDNGGPEQS